MHTSWQTRAKPFIFFGKRVSCLSGLLSYYSLGEIALSFLSVFRKSFAGMACVFVHVLGYNRMHFVRVVVVVVIVVVFCRGSLCEDGLCLYLHHFFWSVNMMQNAFVRTSIRFIC